MEKVWAASYDLQLKAYVKEMMKILDRLDKVGQKKTAIERDRARLVKKPNARKQRALEAEEAKLVKEQARIADAEKKVVERVQLKEMYRATEAAPAAD